MSGLLEAMTQTKLDNQRDVVKNEKRQRIDNQPYGQATYKITETMYPEGHPYHWSVIGSMGLEIFTHFVPSHSCMKAARWPL